MRRLSLALALAAAMTGAAFAGDAQVKSAQTTIESQLKAFQAGDGTRAYSFAAPTIKQMFPTVDIFMSMVQTGYQPVFKPQSYSFGKSEEIDASTIMQQVLIVGPDGKDYEALYRVQLQPDGSYLINGVSLRASNSLST